MDENRYCYKQNMYTSTVSDDSSCTFPLPWLTDTRRRKSRLGKHGRHARVLQEINSENNNNIAPVVDENNEPQITSEKNGPSFDYTKPTDVDTDTQDVGYVESNDVLNSSFIKLDNGAGEISFSNFGKNDLMDISVSKADTNSDMDIIEPCLFSSTDDMHIQQRHVNSHCPNTVLKTSDHSSFENEILNLHRKSYSPEFILKTTNQLSSSSKANELLNPLRTLPVDMVMKTSDYSSMLDDLAIESNRSPLAVDLVMKTNSNSSPSENTPAMQTEIPNLVPELYPKVDQAQAQAPVSKPVENCSSEFKQPEAVRPLKKDYFNSEALPHPPTIKINDKLPACITVNGKSYIVTNVLGSGGSSKVYQVLHPESCEILAIKQVKLYEVDETIAEGYIEEVRMLKTLQKCDSIIKLYDHEIIRENDKDKLLNVVMEKGDTDLAELLKTVNKCKKPSIYMILYYWTEMLSAVYEIHNQGIIHSDLKPANFLIVRGRLKLIDFGIASNIQGDATSVYKDVFTGTLNYMSPEAIQLITGSSGSVGYRINYKTDVWSLGCILYHLIYGRLPFQHLKKKYEKVRAIIDPQIEIEFSEAKGVPTILMSALKACLEKDPKKRMSVAQLLQLPYVSQ